MLRKPDQSSKTRQHIAFVTSGRPRNIHLVPIDYGSRPRLRGRLTLRGLTLRRNPWTFGDRVSHSVCRYSCQHSHFGYLQAGSPLTLRRLTERSATDQSHQARRPLMPSPSLRQATTSTRDMLECFRSHSFGTWLEPRYIFGARFLLDQ